MSETEALYYRLCDQPGAHSQYPYDVAYDDHNTRERLFVGHTDCLSSSLMCWNFYMLSDGRVFDRNETMVYQTRPTQLTYAERRKLLRQENTVNRETVRETTLFSKDFTDEQIPDLPLYSILCHIGECQMLCKRAQSSTFVGTMCEFEEAHRIHDKVRRADPVRRQQFLIKEMHMELPKYDDDLHRRVARLADRVSGWSRSY